MSRRMPPLGPLRAFEAAARHGHFLRAAEELCVTAGAISQQIKQLEDWLGVALFDRVGRGVRLNETGKRFAEDLTESFDRIELTAQRIQRTANEGPSLTVSTTPSFSACWLIPRLGSLKAHLAGVDVRMLVSVHPVDFSREPVDTAVRYGRGVYPGLESRLLFRDVHIPVCSPRILEEGPPLKSFADLAHYTLLHEVFDILPEFDWPTWLKAVGEKRVDATRGPRFNYTHMVLQAALDGQGIAIVPASFVIEHLENGRLVRPFPQAVPAPFTNYLVCLKERAHEPAIASFWNWALKEVMIMQSQMDALGLLVN